VSSLPTEVGHNAIEECTLEKHFDQWNYFTVQELERLCHTLPVLSRQEASFFFKEARKATGERDGPVERVSGAIFESLMGFVSASDRKDFTATWETGTTNIADGVLMVETYDDLIGTLFCVARVSEDMFLTRGYLQKQKDSVKRLRTMSVSDAVDRDIASLDQKKWWKFWG